MKHPKALWLAIPLFLLTACVDTEGDRMMRLGTNYYNDGYYELAEKELRKALDHPFYEFGREEVLTTLGNTYNELEEYDSAIVYHQKALAIDPEYVEALVNVGIVYRLIGEYGKAEEHYMRAHAINPNDPELNASLGALMIFTEDIPKALTYLEKAIVLDGTLAVSHANYSYALALDGQFEKAEQELAKADELGYQNTESLTEMINELR
ncbi:MAG TPA: hypothetical protein DCE41_23390 [Cytophagales bacterium]|nr:hypothetical protein [Cytophagales bacterium]HAA21582.1 hypothetical protein [Cytophagales bacterium]HAP62296.1 hypothetical protein [Cytophagales bacterium]